MTRPVQLPKVSNKRKGESIIMIRLKRIRRRSRELAEDEFNVRLAEIVKRNLCDVGKRFPELRESARKEVGEVINLAIKARFDYDGMQRLLRWNRKMM